jgi:hypothetical protein
MSSRYHYSRAIRTIDDRVNDDAECRSGIVRQSRDCSSADDDLIRRKRFRAVTPVGLIIDSLD